MTWDANVVGGHALHMFVESFHYSFLVWFCAPYRPTHEQFFLMFMHSLIMRYLNFLLIARELAFKFKFSMVIDVWMVILWTLHSYRVQISIHYTVKVVILTQLLEFVVSVSDLSVWHIHSTTEITKQLCLNNNSVYPIYGLLFLQLR